MGIAWERCHVLKKTENMTEGFDWEQKDKDRKVKDYNKNGE